jgi:DNA-binding transcriptional regulator LsrR (DeoR family)
VNVVPGGPTGSGPAVERRLAAAVARRHYLHDQSLVSIAAELGISRFKVARLLESARTHGIVRIEVAEPEVDGELSQELARALGIKRALVLDTLESDSQTTLIGALAARFLAQVQSRNSLVGIAWSQATSTLTEHLQPAPDCTLVQLCGVVAHAAGEEQNVELIRRAARSTGGPALTFYAPLVLDDAATAAALRRQPGIIDVLRSCDRLAVAIIAVGMWAPGCSTVYEALSTQDRSTFAARGAVAESCGILFDASGTPLPEGLQDRVVAVSAEQLRRTPEVIALAHDEERIPAVKALSRSGLVTTLITHRQLAEEALKG